MRKLAATAFFALSLAFSATAAAQASPCSNTACHASIKVKGITHWTSPERMSGQLEKLSVKAAGTELTYQQAGACTAYFYGRGVVARLSVCGRGKVHIRLRAVQVDPRPVTLHLSYKLAR